MMPKIGTLMNVTSSDTPIEGGFLDIPRVGCRFLFVVQGNTGNLVETSTVEHVYKTANGVAFRTRNSEYKLVMR